MVSLQLITHHFHLVTVVVHVEKVLFHFLSFKFDKRFAPREKDLKFIYFSLYRTVSLLYHLSECSLRLKGPPPLLLFSKLHVYDWQSGKIYLQLIIVKSDKYISIKNNRTPNIYHNCSSFGKHVL